MHLPLDVDPGPIGAGAASRNRPVWLFLALLAGCGMPPPLANGNETVVTADDAVWARLPVGARVRLDGTLTDAFDEGARVDLNPGLCAHLAMTRQEWDALIQTTGAGRRVTVYGSKTSDADGCRFQLDQVGLIAR